ncbi:hypothetical protein Sp245p_04350 [Azospirillum baldaniorum]|uniref:Uncharacterized protein n=1 Tax=Azospirillum baldaniorum TaxID=1064539 RepID=A0A9P1NMV7_9PROT|nr:hypothetical protein [Azospirillum baldaniorum]AWJ89070.1 hypothetical protein Sp245p_04350 [Azospirillum baldaniorum]TWA80638.1 hypothetical protein FBZ85_10377 [Azospirillum brasilense]CCC99159.1 protein of unknown function [Azospirillum baldaniorum]
MADDHTGHKSAEPKDIRKTDIEPLCDEQSGGGGSNPDTRYRGMPGGHPGGSRDGDCDPVSRADPEKAEPDTAESGSKPVPR